MISTNQFKNGNHIEVDGTIFRVVEFQHVKPGKGGAFVRTKLKRVSDGAVIDKTFRAGEKFRPVRTETRKMQFLYADGGDAHFMDLESYEQFAIPEGQVGDQLKWVLPSEEVDILYVDQLPVEISDNLRPPTKASPTSTPNPSPNPTSTSSSTPDATSTSDAGAR